MLLHGLRLETDKLSWRRSVMAVEEAEQALIDLFASRSSNAILATAGKRAGAC